MGEVMDAVEVAAGSGDGAIMESSAAHRSDSSGRLAATRNTILRFLQNVPEDMTALELREAIEGDADA